MRLLATTWMIRPTHNLRSCGRHLALLIFACFSLAAPGAAQVEEPEAVIHGFSIPTTRAARARLERARGHVEAKRWNEAIEDLQILIEEHGGDLVRADSEGAHESRVHYGVGDVATHELRAMPAEALVLYRRRFESKASAALELARSRGDRRAVLEVARRWPLCEATPKAWWTVGDLELELGNLSEARVAWARAIDSRKLASTETGSLPRIEPDRAQDWRSALTTDDHPAASLTPAERTRVELAIEMLQDGSPLAEAALSRATPRGSLRLPGPGEAPFGAPSENASAWPKPFRIPTPHPFDRSSYNNLFPVRVGDSVLLSNSLQLFSINAYSGALLWASTAAPGWARLTESEANEFFEGVANRDVMIAPAASERVVVAALQVPVTDLTNKTFRSIAITTIIPDRRLHAFDVETGEPLWNHRPPAGWDGESGAFTDRMSVAGPPIVTASRVLVPMHRMYGRIEFYVACFDLESGELLWSTQLVSGQRELNMFARAETEFTAPPVRIEGDKVIALSQLGAVAALDLFSGAILWETLYDQIPPPPRSNFSAPRLNSKWRNSAPVVADGVVVAAPFDSRDLLGLDLESGLPLWTVQHALIEHLAGGRRPDVDVLVGADARTVYLGCWPVMALKAPAGLSIEAPRTLAWRFPSGEAPQSESTSARPILLADRMVIPLHSERVEVELQGGRRRSKPVPWQSGRSGNLLAEGGCLYTLDSRFLDGYFEWDVLLERARAAYAAAPGELEATLYLASLLAQRGRSEAGRGRSEAARDWLREAGDLLEDQLATGNDAVEAEMHEILRSRSRVFTDLADGQSALRELRRAREYAPSTAALRDCLVEEYELVRGVDLTQQRMILDELEARCGSRSLLAKLLVEPDSTSGWRFVPLSAHDEEDFSVADVEVSLWVTLERQELAASFQDAQGEFTELHRLLQEWPSGSLRDQTLGEYAAQRIAELIEDYGREAYAPFESKARELLDEAQASRNPDLLSLVGDFYPHSFAARTANDELLNWASEVGDVETVALYALAELPAEWAPERGTDRELQMLSHLGAALATAGNVEAARALYMTLAAVAPELQSTAPRDAGRTFGDLAEEFGSTPLRPLKEPAGFRADVLKESAVLGEHTFLGSIPPRAGASGEATSSAGDEVLLFAKEVAGRGRIISLVAYSTDSVGAVRPGKSWGAQIPLREAPSSWKAAIKLLPGLVLASTTEDVYAFDRNTGDSRWSWRAPGGEIDSMQVADGLLFVTTRRLPGTIDVVTALDSVTGAELWSTEFERLVIDRRPACGDGRVVLLPRHGRSNGRVLDAFSGREVLRYKLPESVLNASITGAWIESGLLIVPWFLSGRNPARNRIVAIDLVTGDLAWNHSFDKLLGGRRELRSIVQSDGHTLLLLQPQAGMQQEGVRGLFVELHTGLGATARVGNLELGAEHRVMGVGQERRVQLESPFLYVRSFAEGGGSLRIQQVELPLGNVRWTQRIGVTRSQLYNSQVRLPATGRTTVALVISTKDGARFGPPNTSLYFLDVANGQLRGSQRLEPKLGTSIDITLHGLGDSLLLAGKYLMEVMR